MEEDITKIGISSESIDLFIANHVLEHILDIDKALHEINRVIKVGGFAILQTPYSTKLTNNFEDAGISGADDYHYFYGQEDHVRVFGKNIESFIEGYGFQSHMDNHKELLPNICGKKYGINEKEPLFLFKKIENIQ